LGHRFLTPVDLRLLFQQPRAQRVILASAPRTVKDRAAQEGCARDDSRVASDRRRPIPKLWYGLLEPPGNRYAGHEQHIHRSTSNRAVADKRGDTRPRYRPGRPDWRLHWHWQRLGRRDGHRPELVQRHQPGASAFEIFGASRRRRPSGTVVRVSPGHTVLTLPTAARSLRRDRALTRTHTHFRILKIKQWRGWFDRGHQCLCDRAVELLIVTVRSP
jgi:hypothetical protein